MSDTKEKKIRVLQVAKETGQSADTLMEFLKKKGHKVLSANSPVSEEMLKDIREHYKKDIEKTAAHNKKVLEIKKTAEPVKEEKKPKKSSEKPSKSREEEAHPPVEETVAEPEPVVVELPPPPVEELPVVTPEVEVIEEPVIPEPEVVAAEVPVPEPSPVTEADVQAEETPREEPVVSEPEVVVAKEEEKPVQPELYEPSADRRPKKGLTILGTIDINDDRGRGKKGKKDKKKGEVKEQDARKPGAKPADGKNKQAEAPGRRDDRQKRQRGDQTLFPGTEKLDTSIVTKAGESKTEQPKGADSSQTAAGDSSAPRKKIKKLKAKSTSATEDEILKKRLKIKKAEVEEKEIDQNVRKTLSQMEDSGLGFRAQVRKRKKKERLEAELEKQEKIRAEGNMIKVTEYASVNDLANLMGVTVGEVIQKCMALGLMVSINQRLDFDTITLVSDEFGFKVEQEDKNSLDDVMADEDSEEYLLERSPVVTIMGHVDHGKTSLLDFIRKANVVAGEAGGITQHIGAYKVEVEKGRYITFLDTPGHEAFTAMRARGAQVTDIVVLVVAADDAVMPQTVEAINHAQAANVRIIVAINKIDKPGGNVEKIKQQLADRNILVEEWGGSHQCVELSAKTGKNVDLLLEKILIEAELLQLKANAERNARGIIIESKMDKGRGVTATVLIQKGTLSIGDPFTAGIQYGRVRAMFDERDKRVDSAGPATPVLVIGFEGQPQAGDLLVAMDSERDAREIANKRQQLQREQDNRQVRHVTLDEISEQIKIGGVKELPIIVKGDVDGSVQALADSLMKLSTDQVKVSVIHRGVGAISESDVLLAEASSAIIIGFHVRPNANARKLAETNSVDIRLYNIIYNAINEVKSALEGLLAPILSEEITGTVEVRDTFKVPRVGTVAGCYVTDGKINRNSKLRLIRDGVVIYEGELSSLKRFKDDVREVDAGYECGLGIANFNDIKVGDIIEVFKIIETKQKLS
ncbi:MAG: translation initiation factor IF-2 [Ignavibacteriaceae bacterium]|nr:translation initiation factor IF-2 [Ignavibacteriaceae bacterium]